MRAPDGWEYVYNEKWRTVSAYLTIDGITRLQWVADVVKEANV